MVFIINDSLSRIKRSLVDPAARSIFKRYYVAYISNSDFRGADMGPIEKQYRLMGKYDPTKELVRLLALCSVRLFGYFNSFSITSIFIKTRSKITSSCTFNGVTLPSSEQLFHLGPFLLQSQITSKLERTGANSSRTFDAHFPIRLDSYVYLSILYSNPLGTLLHTNRFAPQILICCYIYLGGRHW